METVIERKCTECKNKIEIKYGDIKDVIFYKRLYYHTSCFCKMAEKKAKSKRGNPTEWQEALNDLEDIVRYTKTVVMSNWPKEKTEKKPRKRVDTDDLNEYLLAQYKVSVVERRFWSTVRDLENGLYRKKKCKKVPLDVLLGAWSWGQHKLDEIDRKNKMNNKGPKTNEERIFYDLAILIKKIPNYLAYKAKQDALMEEARERIVSMNYDSVLRPDEIESEGLDDISDLLDDDDE